MNAHIDELLGRYESGRLTRRQLLAALSAMTLAAPTAAQLAKPPIPVRTLNHATLFVSNVQRSVDFYQGLFGMPVLSKQDNGLNLQTRPDSGFVGIYAGPAGAAGAINHFCMGVERFDADATLKLLTDRGLKARIRMRGDVKELYLTDPDGVSVQLQDVSYRG
jgi:catechol 2,3-dioxygenase-like lactoylglutathione lyase family enzyme